MMPSKPHPVVCDHRDLCPDGLIDLTVIALWSEVLPDSAPHNDPATAIRKKLTVSFTRPESAHDPRPSHSGL